MPTPASQNARIHGLRATTPDLLTGPPVTRFQALQQAVHARFAPACPLEAALCARIATALWRAERADRLEREYWEQIPVTAADPTRLLDTIEADRPTRSLATVLRYQADTRNALSKALRDLERLRSGRLDAPSATPADPADENRTNEPEPQAATRAPWPDRTDRQDHAPPTPNRQQRRRLAAQNRARPDHRAPTDPTPRHPDPADTHRPRHP